MRKGVFLVGGAVGDFGNAVVKRFLAQTLIFLFIAIMPFGISTSARNSMWDNGIILWGDVLIKSPDKARGHDNQGIAYYKSGKMSDAMRKHMDALRVDPFYAEAHNNLGIVYYDTQRLDDAIREFELAVRLNPYLADAHYNLGIAYGDKGYTERAYGEILKAMELSGKFDMEL